MSGVVFNDGGYSDTQYDNAKLREAAKLVAAKLPLIMRETGAQAVAVTGKSGLSLAFAALMLIDFPLIVVRKRGENSHGANIEGTSGIEVEKYLILDDFVSSGRTVRTIVEELEMYAAQRACDGGDRRDIRCVGVVEYRRSGGTPSMHGLGGSGYTVPGFCLPRMEVDAIVRRVRESLAYEPKLMRRASDQEMVAAYGGASVEASPRTTILNDFDFSKIPY